jgi:hypothetical protein
VRPITGRQLGSTEVGKEGERMGWRQEVSGCAELVGCRHVNETRVSKSQQPSDRMKSTDRNTWAGRFRGWAENWPI